MATADPPPPRRSDADEAYNLAARVYGDGAPRPDGDGGPPRPDSDGGVPRPDGDGGADVAATAGYNLAARVYDGGGRHPIGPAGVLANLTVARPRPRIFFGWWIVLAGALINVYAAGVWFYGFPIFYKALLDEFGWSAAAGAAIISLSRLEGGLEGPLIGWLVDRYGPRKLAIIGTVIVGLGFMMMSRVDAFSIGPVQVSAFVAFALLYAGWISVGFNTGFFHASMAAINAWFIKKRSRAFALYSLGAGSSGFTVFAIGWVVNGYGWRPAALLSGVGIFVFVLPLTFVLRGKPEQYGYLPDGDDPNAASAASPESDHASVAAGVPISPGGRAAGEPTRSKVQWPEYDFSLREALSTLAFWMLVLSSAARSVAMTSIILHEIVYLTEVRDIPLVQASAALGAMVSISLIGRISFGFLGDRIEKRYLLVVAYLAQAVGIYILMGVTSMPRLWLFVVVYGIAYGGAIPLFMAIVGEYFGRVRYATIRGFMQLFLLPATVVGPVYAGWVYDTTDSYQVAFVSFIGAMLVGTVFLFLCRRPAPPGAAREVVASPVAVGRQDSRS